MTDALELSGRIVARAAARHITIAVAESLTGGLVAETLVRTPGASTVLRLGVVAYATEMKHEVLRVPAALLAERGPVDPDVAIAMARGVRELAALDRGACTIGVATTGVAGPGAQAGHPPGEFHIGLELDTVRGRVTSSTSHLVTGDREAVRHAAAIAALRALDAALERTDLTMHSESTR
ncbi:CinA family protein [Agrococcus carbonis]|uniref:Competence/damage-inducible protein cinA n=1 Tax=Agrococcus carbonis TaxID=684552 RepID=A0A1H1SIA0_9MICO|nr:CinA family protein [Agrococcus carbonis]SDS47707.1 competence/damage-inducible protein cinA [Agrococcus carbonis]